MLFCPFSPLERPVVCALLDIHGISARFFCSIIKKLGLSGRRVTQMVGRARMLLPTAVPPRRRCSRNIQLCSSTCFRPQQTMLHAPDTAPSSLPSAGEAVLCLSALLWVLQVDCRGTYAAVFDPEPYQCNAPRQLLMQGPPSRALSARPPRSTRRRWQSYETRRRAFTIYGGNDTTAKFSRKQLSRFPDVWRLHDLAVTRESRKVHMLKDCAEAGLQKKKVCSRDRGLSGDTRRYVANTYLCHSIGWSWVVGSGGPGSGIGQWLFGEAWRTMKLTPRTWTVGPSEERQAWCG